jgi:hypothetical protein
MPKIFVGEKALAHLSRGLYRSPASALRELISNAWDANASRARIQTNYPSFYQLTVEDNGDGFTRDQFTKLMKGGIGNSPKRPESTPLRYSRPLIGRLGIGMLGIAQICGVFTITSKPKNGEGFRAKVSLYDLLKERLDHDDAELVRASEVDVGSYEFEEFDPKSYRPGTIITSDELHPTFIRSFQASLGFEKFQEPALDWKKCIRTFTSVHSIQELGDYWRLLWELSVAAPVTYISSRALPRGLVSAEQKRLTAYNFEVVVDGIPLSKPIHLRGNPAGYTTLRIPQQSLTVYGRQLSFHGYIAVQEGSQLAPDELRGLLIRVKGVGIGYYDPSMLDYRYNEGPRSRWITGELFVDAGLEDALNIDRDSFNRFHPEFRALQAFVHETLHSQIFPRVYKQIEVRSSARERRRHTARAASLKGALSRSSRAPITITTSAPDGAESVDSPRLVTARGKVKLYMPNASQIPTKKPHRELASAILAIYEISALEATNESRRNRFVEMVLALLSEW